MLATAITTAASEQISPRGSLASAPVEAQRQAYPSLLPAWADNPEGRELIALIVAERPEMRFVDNGCSAWGGTEYRSKNVYRLKRLYNDALAKLADRERALFEAKKPYAHIHQRLQALMSSERPDALIERMLGASL